MDLLRLEEDLPDAGDEVVILAALDGWTDAGDGGTLALGELMEQWEGKRLGEFDPDSLFDYRDRRPLIGIDEGKLKHHDWPDLTLWLLRPEDGPVVVTLTGSEPDLHWRAVLDDMVEVAHKVGAKRYLGLGSVPGPIPHTRPVRVISTSSDEAVLDRVGRPHDRVIVPASFQVLVEKAMGDAGVTTLGLWARIPHYVAGEYPAAASALLGVLSRELELPLDTSSLEEQATESRSKLDEAASSSPEIIAHLRQLEEAYDADITTEGTSGDAILGPLPTGDQIAAELEKFLREQS